MSIPDIIGMVSDIAVLILTIYTFHITAVSRKLGFISMGQEYTMFYGSKLYLSLKNNALHSIPVTKVFLLKKVEGKFYSIHIADYDQPLVIDAWHIGKIESDAYTQIDNYEDLTKDSELYMNSVLGVDIGDGIVWLIPQNRVPLKYEMAHRADLYERKMASVFLVLFSKITCITKDKALIREAKRAYLNNNVVTLTVHRKQLNDTVLSKSVNYAITLVGKSSSENITSDTVYAIVGEERTLLSKTIRGHNGIEGCIGKSEEEIKKFICEHFQIDENNVFVDEM